MQQQSIEKCNKVADLVKTGMLQGDALKKIGVAQSTFHSFRKLTPSPAPRRAYTRRKSTSSVITIPISNRGNISMSARDFAKFCKELLSA